MALGSSPLWLYVRRQWGGPPRRHGIVARTVERKDGSKMDVRRDFDSHDRQALCQPLSTCSGVHQILRSFRVPPRVVQPLRPWGFHGYSLAGSLVDSHLLCSSNPRLQYRRGRALVARLCPATPRTGVRKVAWIVHGIAWSVFHLFMQPTLSDTIRMAITGVALSFVAQRTRSTWPGIVGHSFGNLTFFLSLVRGVTSH